MFSCCRRLMFISVLFTLVSTIFPNNNSKTKDLPTETNIIRKIGGTSNFLIVKDNYVYASQADYLRCYDISAGYATQKGFIKTRFRAEYMSINGTDVFSVYGNQVHGDFITITNISNPASPTSGDYKINFNFPGGISKIVTNNNYAFLGSTGLGSTPFDKLVIYSISNLKSSGSEESFYSGDIYDYAISPSGNYAYLLVKNSSNQDQLKIMNISTKSSFIQTSVVDVNSARKIAVSQGYLYITCDNGGGLKIFDVTDNSNPVLKGSYITGSPSYQEIFYSNSRLVLRKSNNYVIFDVTDPSAPNLLRDSDMGSNFKLCSYDNNKITFTTAGNGKYIEASNPSSTSINWVMSRPPSIKSTYSDNKHLLIISDDIYYYQNSFPESPTYYRTLSIPNIDNAKVGNNILFAANNQGELLIYDISNIYSPVQLAVFNAHADIKNIILNGNVAFLFCFDGVNSGAVQSIDISNPSNPSLLSTKLLPGSVSEGFLSEDGKYLFTAYTSGANSSSAVIYDITNPSQFQLVANTALNGIVKGIFADLKHLYIGTSLNTTESKLEVYDINSPSVPQFLSSLNVGTNGMADMVTLANVFYISVPGDYKIYCVAFDSISNSFTQGTPIENVYADNLSGFEFRPAALRRTIKNHSLMGDDPTSTGDYVYGSGKEYGVEIIKIPRTPDKVTLSTKVFPDEAAGDGCSISPGGTNEYNKNSTVTISAEAASHWSFIGYSGGLSGTQNPQQLLMNEDKEVTANFLPQLFLSFISEGPLQSCPPEFDEEFYIGSGALTVYGVDWLLNGFDFQVPQNVKAKASEVIPFISFSNNQNFSGKVISDEKGNLTGVNFSSLNITIPENTSKSFSIYFLLDFNEFGPDSVGPCPLDSIRTYALSITPADVACVPIPQTCRPGIRLPAGQVFTTDEHVVACVWNISHKENIPFLNIQPSIDDARTVANDTCIVCSGLYEYLDSTGIELNKSISLFSYDGYEKTYLSGFRFITKLVNVTARNTRINGFTFSSAKYGLYYGDNFTQGGNLPLKNTEAVIDSNRFYSIDTGIRFNKSKIKAAVFNNLFDKNSTGILAENADGIIIGDSTKSNYFIRNTFAGIRLESPVDVQVYGNVIGTNRTGELNIGNYVGIYCYSGNKYNIHDNLVSGNKKGIFMYGLTGGKIHGNYIGVHENLKSKNPNEIGIYVEKCSDIIIGGSEADSCNIISGNSESGLEIVSSDKIQILSNHFGHKLDNYEVGNKTGINLNKCSTILLGDIKKGNSISYNEYGLKIKDSKFIGIVDNLIGLDKPAEIFNEVDLQEAPNTGGGISLTKCESIDIAKNSIGSNKNYNISFNDVNNSFVSQNMIGFNDYNKGGDLGLLIENSDSLRIDSNTVYGNKLEAINIKGSNRITLVDNDIIKNGGDGIKVNSSKTVSISGSIIGTKPQVVKSEYGIRKLSDEKFYNLNNGINIASSQDFELLKNLINNNYGSGIRLDNSSAGLIDSNYIGYNPASETDQGNLKQGIYGESTRLVALNYNIISSNHQDGLFLSNCSDWELINNRIGTDEAVEQKIGNYKGVSLYNCKKIYIGSLEINERNYILNNTWEGINLIGSNENFIGSNAIGGKFNKLEMGNKWDGIKFYRSHKNIIIGNSVNDNGQVGLYLESSGNNSIKNNTFIKNCTGILSKVAEDERILPNIISGNFVMENKCETGIHLYGSQALIEGNVIKNDLTNGVVTEQNAIATITGNNISDNAGFELLNNSSEVMINANENWWGENTDPLSSGLIKGNINYTNWLSVPASFSIAFSQDTIVIPFNTSDSISVLTQKLSDEPVSLNCNIIDSKNWLTSAATFTSVPTSEPGAYNTVVITPKTSDDSAEIVISASSGSVNKYDTLTVLSYVPVLKSLSIIPDSITVSPGGSVYFTTNASDQLNRNFAPSIKFSATKGVINNYGMYKADTLSGHASITATDTLTNIVATAFVNISNSAAHLAEIRIFPDTAFVMPGHEFLFRAEGKDQFGIKYAFEGLWQAEGGSIRANGLYSADSALGIYNISVTDTATNIFDNAVVIIANLTEVENYSIDLPKNYSLSNNYPNPFNPTTSINYTLPSESSVKIEVFNILGQKIETLKNGIEKAGHKYIEWDAKDYSSGIYFLTIIAKEADGKNKTFYCTKKLVLLK